MSKYTGSASHMLESYTTSPVHTLVTTSDSLSGAAFTKQFCLDLWFNTAVKVMLLPKDAVPKYSAVESSVAVSSESASEEADDEEEAPELAEDELEEELLEAPSDAEALLDAELPVSESFDASSSASVTSFDVQSGIPAVCALARVGSGAGTLERLIAFASSACSLP